MVSLATLRNLHFAPAPVLSAEAIIDADCEPLRVALFQPAFVQGVVDSICPSALLLIQDNFHTL